MGNAEYMGKVHELEAELAGTQARTGESAKAYQRAERKCKELAFTAGEDKKNQDRMTDLASKLQSKIKTYKQQIEEAEEIAALNLAKFRKAQQELEEVEERAKLAALIQASSDQNSDLSVEIRRKSDKIRNPTLRQYPHNCEDVDTRFPICASQTPLEIALGLLFPLQKVLCSRL